MKHRRAIFVASLLSLLVAAGQSWAFAQYGTAVSIYTKGAQRVKTIYVAKVVSKIRFHQNQTGNKELAMQGMVETAILIPDAAVLSGPPVPYKTAAMNNVFETRNDPPSEEKDPEEVVFMADEPVEARASLLAPAPPGFHWKGFRSQLLLDHVTGPVSHNYFLVYAFDFYPTLAQAGAHTGLIYTNDDTEPSAAGHLYTLFVGYRVAPAIGGWGLVVLALVMAISGLTLYRWGLTSARSE